jgi:hypothetical protein
MNYREFKASIIVRLDEIGERAIKSGTWDKLVTAITIELSDYETAVSLCLHENWLGGDPSDWTVGQCMKAQRHEIVKIAYEWEKFNENLPF